MSPPAGPLDAHPRDDPAGRPWRLRGDELHAWLRLLETPGVGRLGARRLLAACGSPEEVFRASPARLAALVPPATARALATAPAGLDALVETTLAWRDAHPRRHLLTLGDPDYPTSLLELADPPLLLYAEGDLARLQALSVAVVGSRHATAQGIENARAFAADLSRGGITVVSGLAAGIDAAAHEGALGGPGSTIAVVGTGLDQVYPRRHRDLAGRIAAEGLMLSEFPLGSAPLAAHFPQRNRLIAGLSRGTLVVEAALASGSLITARLAAEAGREVYAIPGSIHAPQSRGCHALIKQGAKLVESTEDILEELRGPGLPLRPAQHPTPTAARPVEQAPDGDAGEPADPLSAALLDALGTDLCSLEQLQRRTGWSVTDLTVRLLTLELGGQVERLPGECFQRIVRA